MLETSTVEIGRVRDVLDDMFGIDKEYQRTLEGWAALIHPDDRAMMVAYMEDEILGQQNAFDKEYRIVRHSDGAVRWVHDLGRLEFDGQGRPVKMNGTVQRHHRTEGRPNKRCARARSRCRRRRASPAWAAMCWTSSPGRGQVQM